MVNVSATTAVIYCRVSSKKQVREGNGLESQEAICREHALKHNIKIDKVFVDGGKPGEFSSREGLDTMISYLGKVNKKYTAVQHVMIDDIDRVVRDVSGWRLIKAEIEGR